MGKIWNIPIIVSMLMMPAVAALAQESAQQVERGRAIANNVCWACHEVAADQEFSPILREPGPDFRAIAKRPDVSMESLTAFLRSTHRMEGKSYGMPNPRLSDGMVREVVSYILSLRTPP
jgi:mono/diheme cytochrome c family protein